MSGVSNDGETILNMELPYTATVTIRGVSLLLYHRYSCESVEAKSKAAKGSAAKKSDDVESYVYRNKAGEICMPGEYLKQAIVHAAKYKQDPRSPRKSAMDLVKASVIALTELCSHGTKEPDAIDQRRVCVNRSAITRSRPCMFEGWEITCQFLVSLPHYVPPSILRELLDSAGKLIGVGDFRPSYGRFSVSKFVVGLED